MKIIKNTLLVYTILLFGMFLSNCNKNNTVNDLQKTEALKNVTIIYDSTAYELVLPSGALSGKSFGELKKEDSATYTNPENYSITFLVNLTADNKKTNSEDAKFDGMTLNIVMDTIKSTPIKATTGPFEVKKNTTLPVQVESTINLKTHRLAGLYIFRQIVDGNDLATIQTPILNYKIGTLQGDIILHSVQENIPTRASDETKTFLKGMLDSGVFEVQ